MYPGAGSDTGSPRDSGTGSGTASPRGSGTGSGTASPRGSGTGSDIGFGPGFAHRFGFGHGFHHRFPGRPFGWVGAPAPDAGGGEPPPGPVGPAADGAAPDVAPTGFGASAEQIRWIQATLNSAMGTSLPTDGVPSPELRAALQTFQSQQGLPASGFAGPDTLAALVKASAGATAGAGADAAAGPPQPPADAQGAELGDASMHIANCNCPSCRGAAAGFGFGTSRARSTGDGLGEAEELELALELLSVRNDRELEQFLGDVFNTIGKGLKSVGSFAAKNVLPVVGPALKQIAKAALPIAGGALGTFIPIPGVGTALGSALGGAVANALEMEVAGLDHEEADIERARRIVRLAGSAMREVALAPGTGAPEAIAHAALMNAAGRHLPAAVHEAAAMIAGAWPGKAAIRHGSRAGRVAGHMAAARQPYCRSRVPDGSGGTR